MFYAKQMYLVFESSKSNEVPLEHDRALTVLYAHACNLKHRLDGIMKMNRLAFAGVQRHLQIDLLFII